MTNLVKYLSGRIRYIEKKRIAYGIELDSSTGRSLRLCLSQSHLIKCNC